MITASRRYSIDSINRISGSHQNFEIRLDVPAGPGFNRVVITDFQIRKAYYVIQAGLNTFTLLENGVRTTVTLTPGNWNRILFTNLISGVLNAASSQGWQYTVSYPNGITQVQTLKFTWTVSNNANHQPSFIFNNHLAEQFGFENPSTNVFVANSLTSVNAINFQAEDQLFVKSDIVTSEQNQILATIYAGNVPDGGTIAFQAQDPYLNARIFSIPSSSSAHFQLTSEDNDEIDLNGANMTFSLLFYKVEFPSSSVK